MAWIEINHFYLEITWHLQRAYFLFMATKSVSLERRWTTCEKWKDYVLHSPKVYSCINLLTRILAQLVQNFCEFIFDFFLWLTISQNISCLDYLKKKLREYLLKHPLTLVQFGWYSILIFFKFKSNSVY